MRDQLIWRDGKRLVAASLDGPKLGPMVEVTKDGVPVESDCFTNEVIAVLLEIDDKHFRIAAFSNGGWHVSEPGPRYSLHCAGPVVTGIHASSDTADAVTIDRVDCGITGCTNTTATVSGVRGHVAAAAMGSATILVWVDDVVRAITGPLVQLPNAKSFVIYDGFRYEQLNAKQTTEAQLIHRVQVIGRGDSAIVALDGEGVHLVHVRDGKPERINVMFE